MEKSLPFYEKPELDRTDLENLLFGANSSNCNLPPAEEGEGSSFTPDEPGGDDI